MPTFDFHCAKCEKTFEATLAFGSKKLPACPFCKSTKVEKLMTPPLGIHFKGSGFYKTDSSRKPKPAETAPTEKKADPKTAPEPPKTQGS